MRPLLVLLLLVGCSPTPDAVVWEQPTAGSSVAGTVELSARAVGESPPPNVVFYAGEQPVAKAPLVEDAYRAVWDSRASGPGTVTLRAKPFGEAAVSRTVTVSSEQGR